MTIPTELAIQIATYLISFGSLGGTLLFRIKMLEKKMDKHNCLMVRMAEAEIRIAENTKDITRIENLAKE